MDQKYPCSVQFDVKTPPLVLWLLWSFIRLCLETCFSAYVKNQPQKWVLSGTARYPTWSTGTERHLSGAAFEQEGFSKSMHFLDRERNAKCQVPRCDKSSFTSQRIVRKSTCMDYQYLAQYVQVAYCSSFPTRMHAAYNIYVKVHPIDLYDPGNWRRNESCTKCTWWIPLPDVIGAPSSSAPFDPSNPFHVRRQNVSFGCFRVAGTPGWVEHRLDLACLLLRISGDRRKRVTQWCA